MYLAEEMGRPFSSLIILPFNILEDESRHKPILFIELLKPQKQSEKILEFFTDVQEIMQVTLERVLFNTKVSRTSLLWNYVFEEWEEALAILRKNKLLRANPAFKKLLKDHPQLLQHLKKPKLELASKTYQFHQAQIPLDQENKLDYEFLYCQDISRYLSLKAALLQSEKISSLASLGENLAHQLNNPLTGILSMVQVLLTQEQSQPLTEEWEAIEEAVIRSQKILQNFLVFSQGQTKDLEVCDLNQVVLSTLPLLKTLSQGIDIQISMEEQTTPQVYGNFSLLQQVIFNLMTNACHAVKAVEARRASNIKITTEIQNNSKVLLKIQDNGEGIPKQYLEKIFQPFWTTKKQGEGTGLGLGISKKFLLKLQGEIQVFSQENQGTSFHIELPLYSPASQEKCLAV